MKNTIILILSLLVIGLGSYFIFDKVIDKNLEKSENKEEVNHKSNDAEQIDIKEDNIQISNDDIKLKSLNIEKYIVDENGVNTKILVTGKIDLEFDKNKYEGVILSGYCLDSNDTKYILTGPSDGRTLYQSGMSDLSLSEDLMSSVTYKDGTSKSISEISWKDVSLKSCKVEKINGFLKKNNRNIPTSQENVQNETKNEEKEIKNEESIKEEIKATLYGDINEDGVVNNKDLTRLQKYLLNAKETNITEVGLKNGDVNQDGNLDAKDLELLMSYLAGKDISLPYIN